MNTDGFDNYQKSQLRQSRYLNEAEQHRLAQHLRSKTHRPTIDWQRYLRPAVVTLSVIIAVLALLSAQPALAHESPNFNPGQGSLFHDSMLAFTLGHYYYEVAQYARALEYFEESIALLPAVAFELAPQDYANLYRMLGNSQLELGMIDSAQASFEQYLVLAGDEADPVVLVFLADNSL